MTTRREIYLDHAATTPVAPEVVAAMVPLMEGRFGNPSSVHRRGDEARDVLAAARAQVASLVGALPEEVVFTGSGSEANNLALRGLLAGAPLKRRRLVVSAVEHPSVLETARDLEASGFPVTIMPVDANGVVDPARLAAVLSDDVALVSVMWVNNETGTIQPVAQLAELAHRAGARFHCDAVQVAGKLPIDVTAAGVDLLTIAGHKFNGPLGAAALIVRRRVRLAPLITGGHQERSRRAGTENLPAIAGFGLACARAATRLADGRAAAAAAMGERLWARLQAAAPNAKLHGANGPRLGSILSVEFPGVEGEAMLHELDARGITVSTGSACSAASPGPSPVLLAMGLSADEAHATVRFSLGDDTSEAEVEVAAQAVTQAIVTLRALAQAPQAHSELGGRARVAGSRT